MTRPHISRACIRTSLSVACALNVTLFAVADGRIIITETMHNPPSNEQKGEAEWGEIANVGDGPIEITNWRLDDEDTQPWADWGSFSCTLPAGAVAVLINQDAVTEEEFRQAWQLPVVEVSDDVEKGEVGEGASETEDSVSIPACLVIPIKWGSLANGPDEENEILQLLDEAGSVICEVNFQAGGDWPRSAAPGGASLELIDITAIDFNDPTLWRAAKDGVDGARHNIKTPAFDGDDVGSPGVVVGLDSPASPPTLTQPTDGEKPDEPPSGTGNDNKPNRIDY
ncbi:MAG: lamin tail domain-containing protein [Phycisphaerales bacterium]